MITLLPSVMHTGSRFLTTLFNGHESIPINGPISSDKNQYIADHFFDYLIEDWQALLPKHQVFISLRHPYRVLASHRARGQSKEDIDRLFIGQWQDMIKLHDNKYFYFHIDHEIREQESIYIQSQIGSNLPVNWSVISENHTHDVEVTDDAEIPKEFIDFYNYTINLSREVLNG